MTQLRNKLSTEYYCVCIFSYNNEEIEAGKRIGDILSGAELQTRELCSSPGIESGSNLWFPRTPIYFNRISFSLFNHLHE